MKDPKEFELFSLHRKMTGARSVSYLNKCWDEVKQKKLDNDVLLKKAYEDHLAVSNYFVIDKVTSSFNCVFTLDSKTRRVE